MKELLKEIREKAKACGNKTKEDRARKGAYVDCILAIKKQLALCNVVDTLPADVLIKSLGEAKEPNEYILKTHNGVWWLEHKHVGSAEPLKQWLTDKPISG